MSPPWWGAFGPAQGQVRCGTGEHTVRWDGGRLIPLDHPDAEGELVMAALGGEAPGCVELAQAWGAHSDDLQVLALGPRSAGDELAVTPDDVESFRQQPVMVRSWASYGPIATWRAGLLRGWLSTAGLRAVAAPFVRPAGGGAPVQPGTAGRPRGAGGWPLAPEAERALASRVELLSLLALGTPFQLRLSGAVAAAWSGDGPRARDRDAVRPALAAALTGRLAPAAAAWLGIDPGRVAASLHEGDGWGRIELAGTGGDKGLCSPGGTTPQDPPRGASPGGTTPQDPPRGASPGGTTLQDPPLVAELPVCWLARVWAPGLAVVGGHLIVDVEEAAWPEARVLALPRPGAEPVALSVRAGTGHQAGHWTVAGTAR